MFYIIISNMLLPSMFNSEMCLTYIDFIMSLATQALIQLGESKAPAGVDVKEDINAAKYTIDILAMLEEKTKGNLDLDESRMLGEMLHNLRMVYVKKGGN